jgi:hypothetical protein
LGRARLPAPFTKFSNSRNNKLSWIKHWEILSLSSFLTGPLISSHLYSSKSPTRDSSISSMALMEVS